MSRPLRIEFPGAVYHVTSRGNARRPIYKDDNDRKRFLGVLESVTKRLHWLCHAFCLMENHYHLLIETPEGNLSRGMRQLNGVYTQQFNRIHKTVGHIFQGRYKGLLVEKEAYLLELARYIVLNPVRARLVQHPSDWPWSSYKYTVARENPPPFLTTDWILQQFSVQRSIAEREYQAFVESGIGDGGSQWKNLCRGIIIGNPAFAERVAVFAVGRESVLEVPREQRFVHRPTFEDLFNDEVKTNKIQRNAAILKACNEFGYSLKEIAEALDLHYTTISKIITVTEEN